MAQIRPLTVAITVLTLAGVCARFSEASQELVENSMYGRHTSHNGEQVRFGSAPVQAGSIVVCVESVSYRSG
jgi:hypothetical protein